MKKEHLFRRAEYLCSACGAKSDKPLAACPGCGAVMTRKKKTDPEWIEEMEFYDI